MRHLAWFLPLLLALAWSSAFPVVGFVSETHQVPALLITGVRIGIAALILLILIRVSGGRLPQRWRDWLAVAAIGLSGNVLPFFLLAWGQKEVSSGVTAVLMALVPTFVVLMAHFLTRDDRITPLRALGVGVALAGALALALPGALGQFDAPLISYLAIFGAAFCYALTVQLVYFVRHLPALTQAASSQLAAVAILIPLLALQGLDLWQGHAAQAWLGMAFLGLVPSAFAAWVLVIVVARWGPTATVAPNYLVPVFGLAFGLLLRGDRLQSVEIWGLNLPLQWMGVGFVFLGLALGAYARSQARSKP